MSKQTQRFSDLVAIAIGIILVISSSNKLANPYQFYSSILAYQVLPESVAIFTASFIPFFQLIIAVLLTWGFWRPPSLLLAGIMFAFFGIAQVVALTNGLEIPCGCMGGFSLQIGIFSITETVVLSCASLFAFWKMIRVSN